jgi:hypothetical protein
LCALAALSGGLRAQGLNGGSVHPEHRAARRAQRQRGLITHRQALACGMTAETIEHRAQTGAWRTTRHGIYVVGGAPPTWEQALLAVTLPFDDCWITHGTAARLWDLRHAPQLDAIEALRPYGKSRRLEGVILRRSRVIAPADLSRHHGIPVTSVARTIVECSGRLSVKQTGEMIDDAIRRGLTTLEDVRACFARLAGGGRRRLRSIRSALALRIPGYDPGESDLELNGLREIIRADLPIPVQQHRVTINGKRYRIDLAYPELKVAIELVGWEWHKGREKFDDDKARSGDLVAEGWRVVEITSRHAPADHLRRISGALLHAAA